MFRPLAVCRKHWPPIRDSSPPPTKRRRQKWVSNESPSLPAERPANSAKQNNGRAGSRNCKSGGPAVKAASASSNAGTAYGGPEPKPASLLPFHFFFPPPQLFLLPLQLLLKRCWKLRAWPVLSALGILRRKVANILAITAASTRRGNLDNLHRIGRGKLNLNTALPIFLRKYTQFIPIHH